ncbi:MAG TPA: hypothetical protein VK599_19005 [Streptosporangiaceae bacterium]|nr:hypothetical protein [Streptosporangiaceae bacterium]
MKTVPLHGKKAAGRAVLVDDEDHELVSRYRWHIFEVQFRPNGRPLGPYAVARVNDGGGMAGQVRMHKLLTGWTLTDHINHDGLDNRRENLRMASKSQNAQNSRPRLNVSSPYKGVSWSVRDGSWSADIVLNGRQRHLGLFSSELAAAYAYDAASRELFGEFACPNFAEAPSPEMLEQWAREHDSRLRASMRGLGPLARHICRVCGAEYESTATGRAFYCSRACGTKAATDRRSGRRRVVREQAA